MIKKSHSSLNKPWIDFNTNITPGHKEGRLHWDDDAGTLEVGLKGGTVKLQVGQEFVLRVKASENISNGDVVYVDGADGTNVTVTRAIATGSPQFRAIGMATEEINSGSLGYINTAGIVRDLDTSTFSAGDTLFLSGTVAGGVQNTPVDADTYHPVVVGHVQRSNNGAGEIYVNIVHFPDPEFIHGLNAWGDANYLELTGGTMAGNIDMNSNEVQNASKITADRLELLGDNVVNRISYPLSGLSAFQQALNVVVDGAAVYMETEDVAGGGGEAGGNLAYVFDEEKHILDCTTGAGTAGKAQIALTVGTATAPQINYVYVIPDGAGVATLAASTSLPTGTFAWHSIVVIQDAATVTSHGPISLQRTTEAVKHNGRGQLSYMREKLRWLGPKYVSGCASTLDDGVAMNLSVTAGVVFQLHRQDFPALNVVTHGATVANASGIGTFAKLENIHDLNDVAELANGDAIGTNKYFSITIWATMASSDQTGNQSKLFVNLPTGVYNSESAVISDSSNFDVRTADQEFNNTAFLVCRVTFKKTAGDHTPVGAEVYSLTGSPMGTIGGGAGSTALTEFSDANFHIYDDGDPTSIIDFEADQITTGNTRTITMADTDVDLATVVTKTVAQSLVAADVAVAVIDGLTAIPINATLNGYEITDVTAIVDDKGVDDTTDIQVRRRRAGAEVDVLSTKVTIGDEWFASDGVVNEANDDLATGDALYIDIDAVHSTTAPNGLSVTIKCEKP